MKHRGARPDYGYRARMVGKDGPSRRVADLREHRFEPREAPAPARKW